MPMFVTFFYNASNRNLQQDILLISTVERPNQPNKTLKHELCFCTFVMLREKTNPLHFVVPEHTRICKLLSRSLCITMHFSYQCTCSVGPMFSAQSLMIIQNGDSQSKVYQGYCQNEYRQYISFQVFVLSLALNSSLYANHQQMPSHVDTMSYISLPELYF